MLDLSGEPLHAVLLAGVVDDLERHGVDGYRDPCRR